jgi:hypothetical protein
MKKLLTNKGKVSLVSDEDFKFLSRYTWHQDKKGYFIARSGDLRGQRLNRVIAERMGLDMSGQIDHEDRDRSNNQRNNLRAATNGLNRANSGLNKNNKSGFKGVHLQRRRPSTPGREVRSDKMGDRWVAQINVRSKKIHLGYFDTPEEAHEVYKAAALKHFGEFANP